MGTLDVDGNCVMPGIQTSTQVPFVRMVRTSDSSPSPPGGSIPSCRQAGWNGIPRFLNQMVPAVKGNPVVLAANLELLYH
jgi:hypothetical protein